MQYFKPACSTADALTLRPYTTGDWPAVCGIHDAARVLELAAGRVDPRAFRAMTEVAAGEEFFDSEKIVACLGPMSTVAGFIAWRGDYITWLYVDPTLQRRGVGRRLLDHALQRFGPEAWTN